MNTFVVVPWHNPEQRDLFLRKWSVKTIPDWLLMVQDKDRSGCARTKNAGIRMAIEKGAEAICILDDDCFPICLTPRERTSTLEDHIEHHSNALKTQDVEMFHNVMEPASRGTPYFNRTIPMMVAASLGPIYGNPDYDAPSQLCHGKTEPRFDATQIHGRYFPMCGMNIAFRVEEFPWCQFVNVPRFDDIWAGFIWQRKAYASGKCFSINGPPITHSRQSNVWRNLRIEVENLERNETIWQEIAQGPLLPHSEMIARYGLSL